MFWLDSGLSMIRVNTRSGRAIAGVLKISRPVCGWYGHGWLNSTKERKLNLPRQMSRACSSCMTKYTHIYPKGLIYMASNINVPE